MAKITEKIILFVVFLLPICFAGCSPVVQGANTIPVSSPAAALENTPTPQPTHTVSPKFPIDVWLSPDLPSEFFNQLHLPGDLVQAQEKENAVLKVDYSANHPISVWVYALVAPFPTVDDGISIDQLKNLWFNKNNEEVPVQQLMVDNVTMAAFTQAWGTPDPMTVKRVDKSKLIDLAWENKTSWAIIPFEDISPKWKVIEVDGQSPIHKDFDLSAYPLTVSIGINSDQQEPLTFVLNRLEDKSQAIFPSANRDPNKMTTVVLTGVTALVRGTAALMEFYDIKYPGQDIRDIMRSADITHISNEIPFSPKCPQPYPRVDTLVFCSQPEYIQLLEDMGTDVVELTGDHFQDWGADAMLYTIDLYNKEGWKYYGGGVNLSDGEKPALFDHNGNRIAFLGCNGKEPGYAGASANNPGAVHCDPEYMHTEIKKIKAEGYLPIVTFQHLEYYSYKANPVLLKDFRGMAEAGAVIVSGSQAHQPQQMEFYDGAFVHYGLGNLFFDQYDEGMDTRQAFIDRHIVYNGKYINTELLTIMFIDNARPRPMTPDERQALLSVIFKASDWQIHCAWQRMRTQPKRFVREHHIKNHYHNGGSKWD